MRIGIDDERSDAVLLEDLKSQYGAPAQEPEPDGQDPDQDGALLCCPYCGQVHTALRAGDDARLICTCDGARKYQTAEDHRHRLNLAVDALFGEECRTQSPEFEPLGDEEIAALKEIAGYVAHGLLMDVSVVVRDGSVCHIGKKVRRTATVKREVE